MKKFNVGIVGYGWAATAHIPAINAGALGQVTRICSSRSLEAREVSARHGCTLQTGANYPALLADPAIHVVSICSYHHQHKEQAIERGEDMPLTGLKEAVLTQEVIFAAGRSLQLGRPAKLAEIRDG